MPAEDGNLSITKSVLNMWVSLQMPGSDSEWGEELEDVKRKLSAGNPSGKLDDLSIDSIFYDIAYIFDLSFLRDKAISNHRTERILIDMDEFVLKCGAALALDSSDCNTIDIVLHLFPQFPDLVGEISNHYILSSRKIIEPDCSIRSEILNEVFDYRLSDFVFGERTPLRNQSILSMMESHPQLYARWSVEPKLRVLYRKFIDRVSLHI